MSNENTNTILFQLKKRNRQQSEAFSVIINAHNKLFDNAETYRTRNLQLTVDVERLKQEVLELRIKNESGGGGGTGGGEKTQALEQKLLLCQEELTELHRKKGQNAQEIIDKNNSLQEKEKLLLQKDNKIQDLQNTIYNLQDAKQNLEDSILEHTTSNQTLADEHRALQLAYTSIEKSLRKMQDENTELVQRWMKRKSQDADQLNAENDKLLRKKQEKMRQELKDATVEPVNIPQRPGSGPAFASVGATIPSGASDRKDAHDGEVHTVKWCQTGSMFATGGADRKIQLWDVVNGKCEKKGTLTGSSGVIMCVEFENNEGLLLGGSSDHASRVWSLNDQRLKHTLTGHCGKILAAKFLGEPNKVVSGSHDRTLKIWDLRSKACSKTLFAGSKCNDLVVWGSASSSIISGHFDKTVRFWDMRSDTTPKQITLEGRVTSVDISPDHNTLLCCARDDTIRLIDLRQNQIVATLSNDAFRVSSDCSRAVFSPDGQYVMAGSQDGTLCIWNVAKQTLEKALTKEHVSSVLACSWNPLGNSLLSSDKKHRVVLWSDY